MDEVASGIRSSILSRQRGETLLCILGALAILVILTLFGGTVGLGIGVIVAISGVFLPRIYAFAVGHLGILVAISSPTVFQLAVAELSLVPILVAPLVAIEDGLRSIAATSLCYIGLAAVVATGIMTIDALWLTAVILAILVMSIGYGIHRYEQLQLGLVEETA